MNSQENNEKDQFLVHHEDKVQGPFDAEFIETMILAGVYPRSVKISKIEKSSSVARWSVECPEAPSENQTSSISEKKATTTEEAALSEDQRSPADTSAPRSLLKNPALTSFKNRPGLKVW